MTIFGGAAAGRQYDLVVTLDDLDAALGAGCVAVAGVPGPVAELNSADLCAERHFQSPRDGTPDALSPPN